MRRIKSIKLIEKFDLYDITVDVDHCFELENGVIAHNSLFPKDIVSGGTGGYYSADTIWILGRQQDKDSKGIKGYYFIINVEKSRYVKEKSKIPISISWEGGINRYSGLLEQAVEAGTVIKIKPGWYASKEDPENGLREAKLASASDFWKLQLADIRLTEYIKNKYKQSESIILTED